MAGIHAIMSGRGGRKKVQIVLSANQTNYVLNTAKVAGYQPNNTDVELIINSGVSISANSTSAYAFDVDTSWGAYDTVSIVNNGTIVGMGGNGGQSAGMTNASPSATPIAGWGGGTGGPAFIARRAVSLQNNGTIAGGGGGGGSGRTRYSISSDNYNTYYYITRGGGGGGGRSSFVANSAGGAVGSAVNWFINAGSSFHAVAGTGGTSSGAGAGGRGDGINASNDGGHGGGGGGWGAAGGPGSDGVGYSGYVSAGGPYAGGSGGVSVAGNGNITWVATGTRLGAIT